MTTKTPNVDGATASVYRNPKGGWTVSPNVAGTRERHFRSIRTAFRHARAAGMHPVRRPEWDEVVPVYEMARDLGTLLTGLHS